MHRFGGIGVVAVDEDDEVGVARGAEAAHDGESLPSPALVQHRGAGLARAQRRRIGGRVVDDDDQRAGKRAPEVLDDLADALLLVAAGDDDRDGLARPPERGTVRPAQLRGLTSATSS